MSERGERMRVFTRGRQLRKTRRGRRESGEITAELLRCNKMNAYSAFAQFLQLRDKCCQTVGEVAVVLPKLLPVAVEHDDRGKSFNLILLRQFLILLP